MMAAAGQPQAACTLWRTLNETYPYCDAPGSGTQWAVNLTKLIGPPCDAQTGDDACCFVPLGYDHGPGFGTSCAQVCGVSIV